MKSLMMKVIRFPLELLATLVVCGFIFAAFAGLGAAMSGNHRFRSLPQ